MPLNFRTSQLLSFYIKIIKCFFVICSKWVIGLALLSGCIRNGRVKSCEKCGGVI